MTPAPARPPGFRGRLSVRPQTLERYATASGPYRWLPLAVAAPADAEDLSRLVRWAKNENAALVARGAGTGMPGGNVGPYVVVDLAGKAFRWVSAPDTDRSTIGVGAGAVAMHVQEAAAESGLDFPPLPSSAHTCSIGGMIAAGAAGARSFGLGAIADWVTEVDVVLANGRAVTLARGARTGVAHVPVPPPTATQPREGWPAVTKNASGYALDRFGRTGDLVDLIVGSEGTLALVTAARLRLRRPPAHRTLVLAGAPDFDGVAQWAEQARRVGATACEFIGPWLVRIGGLADDSRVGPLLTGEGALVLIEIEGERSAVEEQLLELRSAAADLSPAGTLDEPSKGSALWALRHRASPTIAAFAGDRLRSLQFIEDGVVPPDRLSDYLTGLTEILRTSRTDAAIFGHAGDANVHVNPLVDITKRDWRERVRGILEETTSLVAGLGGTMTGEHGDGRLRAPLLDRIWSDHHVNAFRSVKAAFDPAGVLNPGVILPLPGQDPLDGLSAAGARSLHEG